MPLVKKKLGKQPFLGLSGCLSGGRPMPSLIILCPLTHIGQHRPPPPTTDHDATTRTLQNLTFKRRFFVDRV
jgi:hypothetical protein